jgi:hypothetical protein
MSQVQAEGLNSYAGIQYGQADADIVDLDFALIRMGIEVTDQFHIEGRFGTGIDDDHYRGVKIELKTIGGAYAAYHLPVTENISAYAIGGWTRVKLKASNGGNSVIDHDNGASYGAGVEVYGVTVEWMQYLDTDDIDASAVSIGYNYHFK